MVVGSYRKAVVLFAETRDLFLGRWASLSYSSLLEELGQFKTADLQNWAENLFDAISREARNQERLYVFIENWIPEYGNHHNPRNLTCLMKLWEVTRDAEQCIPQCIDVQSKKCLYKLFLLVTLNFLLRNREDIN